jgi:hypothetical protein
MPSLNSIGHVNDKLLPASWVVAPCKEQIVGDLNFVADRAGNTVARQGWLIDSEVGGFQIRGAKH